MKQNTPIEVEYCPESFAMAMGQLPNCKLKMGNSSLLFPELVVHKSLTTKVVKFQLQMKDFKWGRERSFKT